MGKLVICQRESVIETNIGQLTHMSIYLIVARH